MGAMVSGRTRPRHDDDVMNRPVRGWALGLVVVAAGVSMSARGHQPEPDEKVVAIDTLNVSDTVYHLTDGGGNALAFIDEMNGDVILIDTKLPGWGAAVTEAIVQITDLPVTTIIASHAHADHVGSNGEFPDAQLIIAHENTAANMARVDADAAGRPTQTFTDRFSLLDGFDRIDLYYFGPAHTDGDIVVVFPEKGVAYLGDLFPSKSTPVIDVDNGGSGIGFPDTLAKAVAGIEGATRVITGHGPFPSTYAGRGRREQGTNRAWTGWMTWDDLAEYADFNRDFLTAVQAAFDAGQSVDEAAATLTLSDRYANYGMEQARANIEAIYAELAAR